VLPTIVTVNPFMKHKRKRAKSKRAAHRRARSYTAHRQHSRRRRSRRRSINPFKSFTPRGAMHDLTAAAIGAGGAVLTDVAMAYAAPYLPQSLQTGWMNILTRAAVAVGVGFAAGKVVGRDTGKAIAAGGLIVVAYSGLKQALAPTLGTSIKGLSGLADFGDYRPAYSGESVSMVGAGMGAYMGSPRLGAYMSPGSVVMPGGSPIRAKQMGAYMRMGGFGGGSGYSEDM
jgi:hypothetical protein